MPLPFEETMVAASAAGAAASTLTNRADDPRYRKICEGLCGALVGVFCGPALADVAHLGDQHLRMAAGFAAGAAGALGLTAFMGWAKGASLKEWLQKLIGKPNP